MRQMKPERVLILSGDHIYRMDYRRMLEQHLEREADLSIAVMEVAAEDVNRFGMIWTDPDGTIVRFEEKPAQADTRLASMGIYLFEWSCLVEALEQIVATRQGYDFGFDIMARLLTSRKVAGHRFDGYWRDVGTISSFYAANMDALDPGSGLVLDRWEICTRDEDNPGADRIPTRIGCCVECRRSLVSAGCVIEGTVVDSILSPDVRVEAGARVERSILMDGVVVGAGAVVVGAVLDKQVEVGPGATIDAGRAGAPNQRFDKCQRDREGRPPAGRNAHRRQRGHRLGLVDGRAAVGAAGRPEPGLLKTRSTRSRAPVPPPEY